MNLQRATDSPVSGIKYEANQDIFQGRLAREGIAAMAASQRQASKDQKKASTTSSAFSLLPF